MASTKNSTKLKKPNIFAWWLYTFVSGILTFFSNKITFNRTAFKNRNKDEGCIVLFSHNCKKDHFIITRALNYTRAAYVVSSHFYYKPVIRFLLKLVRAIPKEQFKSDIGTIKKIRKTLQNKVPVMIAPAGQISIHGDAMEIDRSIVKLLKMCRVDVYAVKVHGAYFAYPKWRKYDRKTKMHTEFVKVFTKEELETLSDNEIYEKVCNNASVNDRKELNLYNYKLKSPAIIEGLETIIYRCPKCMSKGNMVTSKNLLTCTNCNNQVKMTEQGLLEGVGEDYVLMQDEAVWYKWEQNYIANLIKKHELYIEGNFDMFCNLEDTYKLEKRGTGKIVLTDSEFYYEGTLDGNEIKKNFKLEALVQLPFEVNSHFNVPDDEGYYEFKPITGQKPSVISEFVQSIDIMARLRK